MADKGVLSTELVHKRITVEIGRLRHMIETQELEMMELDERKAKLQENIDASLLEIGKQETNLEALVRQRGSSS